MANRYAGTPLSAEWDAVQRRRAINQALLEQAMTTPGGTEYVRGGRLGAYSGSPLQLGYWCRTDRQSPDSRDE